MAAYWRTLSGALMAMGLLPFPWAPVARAQEIYSFPTAPAPWSKLVQGPDGALYGTTGSGGLQGYGTVFRVTPSGDFTTLVSFAETNGRYPTGGLTLGDEGALYGTTIFGGAQDQGTVFKVTTNGVFTTLASFSDIDTGEAPQGTLVRGPDGAFYGTDYTGLFRVTTNGILTHFASLPEPGWLNTVVEGGDGAFYVLTQGVYGDYFSPFYRVATNGDVTTLVTLTATNSDPLTSGLVLGSDGAFYGTSANGGGQGWASVFRLTTNGVFTRLVSFDSPDGPTWPMGGLVSGSDGLLYGACQFGGLFAITTNGTLQLLGSPNSLGEGEPSIQGDDGAFYGAIDFGGSNGVGSIFRVTTNGEFCTVFSFPNTEGLLPQGELMLAGNGALYGTTQTGGLHNQGMVYRVTADGAVVPVVNFNGSDGNGGYPYGGLVVGPDGGLYGTTFDTVFRLSTNGSLTTLAYLDPDTSGFVPMAALTLGNDGAFYGTTSAGGSSNANWGAVFRVTTNGVLTTLVSFNETNGAYPKSPLVQGCDGAFYGTTSDGGPVLTNGGFTYGTIFRVTTNGELSTLFTFDPGSHTTPFDFMNYYGPCAGVVMGSDCALYGTAGGWVFRLGTDGGMSFLAPIYGVTGPLMKTADGSLYGAYATNTFVRVFKVDTNGVVSSMGLVSLGQNSPVCGSLTIGADGYLYGLTSKGGSRGGGSIFRVPFATRPLSILSIGFPSGWLRGPYITFTGFPGQPYRLLRATSLSGPWVSRGEGTVPDYGVGSLADWQPPLPQAAFYKVIGP